MLEPATTPPAGLLELLAWFSPAMPTGAYSYSHGLEWAVEMGRVRDPGGLQGYVETVLRQGSGRLDAAFLCTAYRASRDGSADGRSLEEIVALAAALRGTRELALESGAQGRALLAALRQAWPAPALDELEALCRRLGVEPPYACVAGIAAASRCLPLTDALIASLHALAANLISAVTAALAGPIEDAAEEALEGSLEDLGTASPVIDWCSMRHETQYTRLFRS
jgi:urease accessory protein